jgi:hypothetical protein
MGCVFLTHPCKPPNLKTKRRKNMYDSDRIRSRTARALLKEFSEPPRKIGVVKKWMGYVEPEAWKARNTPYSVSCIKDLRAFLKEEK